MQRKRHRMPARNHAREDKWFDADAAIREIRENTRMLLEGLRVTMDNQGIINLNIQLSEEFDMSRYTDMLANITKQTDEIAAFRAVFKALADSPTEAEWADLNAKILANTAEVVAAAKSGTPAEEPPVEEPPAPLPSGGGAGFNE